MSAPAVWVPSASSTGSTRRNRGPAPAWERVSPRRSGSTRPDPEHVPEPVPSAASRSRPPESPRRLPVRGSGVPRRRSRSASRVPRAPAEPRRRAGCPRRAGTARGDPLERAAAHAEDADAAAPHRLVDAAAVREGRVEAARELDRGGIADGELHGGDRADAAVGERRGGAREQVGRSARARLARVQHDQAGRRLGLVEQVREARGGDVVGAAVASDEREHALVGVHVVRAVSHEVQHVPLPLEQLAVHARPRHLVEPLQFDPPRVEVRPQGLLESFALAVDVERGQAARRGDHAEHPHRGLDGQGGRSMRSRHVTDERFLPAQVGAGLGVEEGLPRQCREAGRREAQRDLHARAALGGDRHARAVRGADSAAERRFEEAAPDLLHDGLGVRHDASCRDRRRQHGRLEERSSSRRARRGRA